MLIIFCIFDAIATIVIFLCSPTIDQCPVYNYLSISGCPSFKPVFYLSLYLSIYLYIYVSIYICLSIYQSTYRKSSFLLFECDIYLLVCLSVCIYLSLSIYPSPCELISLSTGQYIIRDSAINIREKKEHYQKKK